MGAAEFPELCWGIPAARWRAGSRLHGSGSRHVTPRVSAPPRSPGLRGVCRAERNAGVRASGPCTTPALSRRERRGCRGCVGIAGVVLTYPRRAAACRVAAARVGAPTRYAARLRPRGPGLRGGCRGERNAGVSASGSRTTPALSRRGRPGCRGYVGNSGVVWGYPYRAAACRVAAARVEAVHNSCNFAPERLRCRWGRRNFRSCAGVSPPRGRVPGRGCTRPRPAMSGMSAPGRR